MSFWHVYAGDLLGGYGLITAEDSPKSPSEMPPDLGPDVPHMKLVASFDHEPSEDELDALR